MNDNGGFLVFIAGSMILGFLFLVGTLYEMDSEISDRQYNLIQEKISQDQYEKFMIDGKISRMEYESVIN
ncbi:MAG: hypothetical protein ACXAC2_16640 [Candidatus Kariarchaeaceae archaeon]|jgi:hypothetical protein